jgi:hypothetical protein
MTHPTYPNGAAYFYFHQDDETGELSVHIREGFATENCPEITKLKEDESGILYKIGDSGQAIYKDGELIWTPADNQ